MTITFKPHSTTTRFTIGAEVGNASAAFSSDETTIVIGNDCIRATRPIWKGIIAASANADVILDNAPAPLSVAAAPSSAKPGEFPALGYYIGGGFCAGPQPLIAPNAVLIVADIKAEAGGKTFEQANEYCQSYRGGDFDDWRNFHRFEGIFLFDRLGPNTTAVETFKEGGEQAFSDTSYWTGQAHQFHSSLAWYQYFGYGRSDYWYKRRDLRVRPVRIHFI